MRPRDGRAIPTFIGQALLGEPLTVAGGGRPTRAGCYVEDLTEGMGRLLHSELAGPVNLGNCGEMSVLELARLIIELTGSSSEIVFVERPQDDPTVRRPEITLARSALGWEPVVEIRDGLQRTIDWFRSQSLVLQPVSVGARTEPAAPDDWVGSPGGMSTE